jgi:hypothetical protein
VTCCVLRVDVATCCQVQSMNDEALALRTNVTLARSPLPKRGKGSKPNKRISPTAGIDSQQACTTARGLGACIYRCG